MRLETYCCDFRHLQRQGLIGPSSINVGIADPPWDQASLPLYGDTAELFQRVLVPGGVALVYGVDDYLPQVMEYFLASGLSWVKPLSILHGDGTTPIRHGTRTIEGLRHVWMFSKGRYRGPYMRNVLASGRREKDEHPWQQSLAPLVHWLMELTGSVPDQRIFSPFMGSGTDLVAAKLIGLSAIGTEIEPETWQKAVQRIKDTQRDPQKAADLSYFAVPRKRPTGELKPDGQPS